MAEKKNEKKVAAPKKATTKKVTHKKVVATKAEIAVNAENAGFKAGDVYNALDAAGKAMSVKEVAEAAKITEEETLLGMGWLFKEGKITDEKDKIVLA